MNAAHLEQLKKAQSLAAERMSAARTWPAQFDADGIFVSSGLVGQRPVRAYYSRVKLAAPPDEVARYMADDMLAGLAEWSAEYVEGEVLETLWNSPRDRGWRMRVRYATPRPLADREYVYLLRRNDGADGEILVTYDSLDDNTPVSSGCVRARLDATLHRISPQGGQTLLEHLLVTDLGGAIPPWVQRNLLTGAMVQAHVRDARAIRARLGGPTSNAT